MIKHEAYHPGTTIAPEEGRDADLELADVAPGDDLPDYAITDLGLIDCVSLQAISPPL